MGLLKLFSPWFVNVATIKLFKRRVGLRSGHRPFTHTRPVTSVGSAHATLFDVSSQVVGSGILGLDRVVGQKLCPVPSPWILQHVPAHYIGRVGSGGPWAGVYAIVNIFLIMY